MTYTREKIFAFFSFGISVLLIFEFLYLLAKKGSPSSDEIPLVVLIILSPVSSCLYIYWTKFGELKIPDELQKISIENEILKKKIEQKELKEKLNKKE